MDDLAGLDWNSSGTKQPQKPSAPPGSNYFPSLRPTPPASGRSTPAAPASGLGNKAPVLAQGGSNTGGGSNTLQPSRDSFANLFSSNSSANSTKNLSLAEQQRRLQQQKLQQASGSLGTGSAGEDAWARLGGGGSTLRTGSPLNVTGPVSKQPSPQITGGRTQAFPAIKTGTVPVESSESEADILAAFNADAPVDRSSHFPAPSSASTSKRGTPAPVQGSSGGGFLGDDDDDPFGLGVSAPKSSSSYTAVSASTAGNDDDFDILGDLGKPVSELPPRRPAARSPARKSEPDPEPEVTHPGDKAVAELVDMGFPAEKAQQALEETDGNVQAAVGWLLTQAHAESRSKTQTPVENERRPQRKADASERASSSQRRGEAPPDAAQKASELGASLWKGANSLWKSGKKQLDKAVADFNTEGGASQPKWMREASSSRSSSAAPRQPKEDRSIGVTDEAMMLDSHDARPQPRSRRQEAPNEQKYREDGSTRSSRDQSPALPSRPASGTSLQTKPAWQQQQQQPQAPQNRSKLSRQMVEEENAQAYVSPARRKKAAVKPVAPEPDLLDGSSAPALSTTSRASSAPSAARSAAKPAVPKSAPIAVRPATKLRTVPSVSAIALKSSTQHRAAGTASFKRGDYASADSSYSSAIMALPAAHPVVILLLTNRATTRLKIGDAKGALADADQAVELIGLARGAGEAIEVLNEDGGGGTSSKEMGPFWGKAIMKRAEALEHMERWADAAAAWRDAVQGGAGGANAIQARNRCESAARPKPASKPAASSAAVAKAASAKARTSARPAIARNPESAQAVTRLREANREAERVDEEKFRLADQVDERVNKWRKGKEANLRALLGSLDTVLWPDSGWKQVGMSELIVPGKVKIAYMKGIAKVHPDKLPTTATTEQIMISGVVFSTLNEAWDKFKTENNL